MVVKGKKTLLFWWVEKEDEDIIATNVGVGRRVVKSALENPSNSPEFRVCHIKNPKL